MLPMALRSCLVSCRDLAGTDHAVEVTAKSLYEAVAQALGILRGDIWVEEIGEGLTELKVRVKQPAVEHRVRMKDFRRWLESHGKTCNVDSAPRWFSTGPPVAHPTPR